MRFTIAGLAGTLVLLASAGFSTSSSAQTAPAVPPPSSAQTAPTVPPAASDTAPLSAANPKASVEATTIGDLVANDKTKAVLAQDMPALLSYDGLDQIKGMTLRDISKYPQADLDQTKLAKIQKDFDAIPTP
jgi:hypothetical protein